MYQASDTLFSEAAEDRAADSRRAIVALLIEVGQLEVQRQRNRGLEQLGTFSGSSTSDRTEPWNNWGSLAATMRAVSAMATRKSTKTNRRRVFARTLPMLFLKSCVFVLAFFQLSRFLSRLVL